MGTPGSEMTHVERMEMRNRHWLYAEQVFEMFTRGESFRAIATATEIPLVSVHKMVKQLGAEYVDQRYGDRNAVIGRELAILDSLTRKNLRKAQDGDKDAAQIVLQSSRERRRLLGLDAAVSLDVIVKTPLDVEIERMSALLSAPAGTE